MFFEARNSENFRKLENYKNYKFTSKSLFQQKSGKLKIKKIIKNLIPYIKMNKNIKSLMTLA